LSLGASRERLIRQLATESCTLSALGGLAALAVAYGIHGIIVRMLAESEPQFHLSFVIDPLMLAFLASATFAASIVFGAIPAWQASRIDLVTNLKDQSRCTVGSAGQLRAGRFLVSLQLALSLPLLVGAGLLTRTVLNLQRVDLGYSAERLVVARVDLGDAFGDLPRSDRLLRELLGEVHRIAGVKSATFSQLGLFSGGNSTSPIEVEGYTRNGNAAVESDLDRVGPSYFTTLGVPVRAGRDIHENDRRETLKVCVINEMFAKRYFEGRNPIGSHVSTVAEGVPTRYQIVGVAGNARIQQLRDEVEPRFFVPAEQRPSGSNSRIFLVRTTGDSTPVIAALYTATERTGGPLAIASATTLKQQMAPLTSQDETMARLAIVFGLVALALAAIGLYGVLSHGVARRTSEIAIRMALGARSGRVISMILGEISGLVVVGLAIGGGLAYVAARLITSRLYGIDPQDPVTVAWATSLLLAVSLVAAFLPARRAAKLDPMTALRQG
jgi:predicted permease